MDEKTEIYRPETEHRPKEIATGDSVLKRPWNYLKKLYFKFNQDEGSLLAATLSYFTLFSLFPAIMLIIAIFGFFIGYENSATAVTRYIGRLLPGGINLIRANIGAIVSNSRTIGIIGLAGLLWGASGIFGVLEIGLNRILGIKENRGFLNQKLMSFAMVSVGGAVVLFSVGFRAAASYRLFSIGSRVYPFLSRYSSLLSIVFTFILFGLIYYVLPNHNVSIGELWRGTVFAGTAFELLKTGFIWYLESGYANYARVYGPVSTVILLLLWINLSATVLIIGAEINSLRRGPSELSS